MRKIKTVQIGTGHDHAWPNFCSAVKSGYFDMVGYVVPDEYNELKNGFEDSLDVPKITLEEAFAIEGLEAVIIETYDLCLVKYAQMCAERGLHVFMDKPGSQNVEDFEKLLSTIKKNNLTFIMGYMYRYNPAVNELKKMVADGELGKIYSVEAHMSCDHPIDKRQWQSGFKGGMTFFLGSHLVDLIYTFMGMPEEIIPFNTNTGLFGVTSDDLGFVVFKYKNGLSFLKTCDAEVGGSSRRQLVVCGDTGTVKIGPLEEGVPYHDMFAPSMATVYKTINKEHTWSTWSIKPEISKSEVFPRYADMLVDFAKRVINKVPTSEESLKREATVHRIILASCGIECDYKAEINL